MNFRTLVKTVARPGSGIVVFKLGYKLHFLEPSMAYEKYQRSIIGASVIKYSRPIKSNVKFSRPSKAIGIFST